MCILLGTSIVPYDRVIYDRSLEHNFMYIFSIIIANVYHMFEQLNDQSLVLCFGEYFQHLFTHFLRHFSDPIRCFSLDRLLGLGPKFLPSNDVPKDASELHEFSFVPGIRSIGR